MNKQRRQITVGNPFENDSPNEYTLDMKPPDSSQL